MQTNIQNKLFSLLFIAIFAIASFLRVYKLDSVPNGFHADEASFYINALALAETGADEDNNKYPLSLNSLIDPKPALFSYFQIPFISSLENQVFAARIPSAIFGIFSLFFIYLLSTKLMKKENALLLTTVISFSPWHIMVSRGTQEVIASFFFLVVSLYLLLHSLKSKNISPVHLLFFILSAFLSMYFYHSSKVLLPLIAVLVSLLNFKKEKTYLKKVFLTGFFLLLTTVASFFVQESSARVAAVGIFSDEAPQHALLEQIYTAREEIPILTLRVFYNKPRAYISALSEEYLAYFDSNFLFLEGGKPNRYIVPDHGLLYLIEFPLLLLGFYFSIKNKRKEFFFFLILLLLAPLPAALTRLETPSIIRSFPMNLALAYFISMGAHAIYIIKPKIIQRSILFSVLVVYLWHIGYFGLQYSVQAHYDEPWYRNNPYTDIAKSIVPIFDEYNEIRITNDLRPLYSYFVIEKLISTKELQEKPLARNNKEYKIGKFFFNRSVCKLGSAEPRTLYIAETQCRGRIPNGDDFEVLTTIKYPDGTPVYEILQAKP